MSASLNNANLEGTRGVTSAEPTGSQSAAPGIFHAPGREALQALLAFSSLHEQIRNRRARALRSGSLTSAAEVSATDQFALDEVLQLVCERALAITGTDGVAIALSDGEETRCRAAAGSVGPSPGVRLDPRSGFSGACFRTGLIVRCDDSEKDPRVDGEACRRMGLHSMVAVPLMTERGVIGLLEAFCCEAFGFNDSDVRSLSLLAELVLAVLQPAEDSRPADRSAHAADRSVPLYDEVSQPVQVEAPQSQIPQAVFPEAVFPEIEKEHISASTEVQLPNVQSVRDALARVTEDSTKITSSEPARSVTIFSPYALSQPQEARKFPRKLVIVVLLVLVGLVVAAGALWWRMRGKTATVAPSPQAVASSTPPETAGSPDASTPPPAAENSPPAASQESPQPQVTGIRHWSSLDSSTVAIDLQNQVQYEAHRLTDPERSILICATPAWLPGCPKTLKWETRCWCAFGWLSPRRG